MQTVKPSIDLQNNPTAKPKDQVTVTANVINKSKTDATGGTVVFDNAQASCTVTFGFIRSLGGTASSSCTLDGYFLTVKGSFTGSDGSGWFGIWGDGQEHQEIDINLNDAKT